ncbi:MAG: transposase [Patescibacteria group bacterium]
MSTRVPFGTGEWYHCYCRGVDKRKVFLESKDYERFILSMHAGNGPLAVHLSNILRNKKFNEILTTLFQNEHLVDIGAFCLMPNHFHLLLKEVEEGGISLFMQKVLTGYTMYFNEKYERKGALFANTYNSRHIFDDRYFKKVIAYIHLNPVELDEINWKVGSGDIRKIEKRLRNYKYSSLSAFTDIENPSNSIISGSVLEIFDSLPSIREMLADAQTYYQEQNIKV